MQTIFYNFYIIGVYDSLYSAVHPMEYLESDVMWYKCNEVEQSILAEVEKLTKRISGIQECTLSDYIPICAIGCFDFSPPTDEDDREDLAAVERGTCCIVVVSIVFVCLLGTMIAIGVALLGWSSFEFNTIQGNG